MICPHCGHSVPEAPFCTNCGGRTQATGGQKTSQEGWQNDYSKQAPIHSGSLMEPVRSVSFSEAIQNFFRNYANFSGRATRSEYWYVTLFNFVINSAFSFLGTLLAETVVLGMVVAAIGGLYGLFILIPGLSLAWRRLHDIGKSGVWYLMILIPIVGVFIVLYYFCKDSAPDNGYGPRKTESNRNFC